MLTFADPLRRAERCFADRLAVIDGATRLTFRELLDRCRRAATAIAALTAPGDRVAVLGANSHRWLELFYALPWSGRAIVPLNGRLSEPELAYQLIDSGATLLFTDRPPAALGGLASLVDRVVDLDEGYEALLAGVAPTDPQSPIQPESLAGLFYTGGTTGAAKGVMTTHANKLADTLHLSTCVQLRESDHWLVVAPMFHASGTFQALLCVWFGIPQLLLPGFDAGAVLDAIDAHRATITFGVPTMMRALAEEQEREARSIASLRLFGYGAAPASSSLLRRFHSCFPAVELVSMYGATELSPMATAVNHAERFVADDRRARTAGRPLIGVDVRVVDERDDECPMGVIGEVVARGSNVMAGYWGKPEATNEALRGGWYHTGDLGHFDDDGLLYLVDRKKDMIVTGGENVYSSEVEEVVARHPAVAECAVFAVPDDEWGEVVAVAVVARADTAIIEADLRSHCRAGLAGYKVPRRVLVLDELPRTGAGKILKRELRAPFWEGRDRAIN